MLMPIIRGIQLFNPGDKDAKGKEISNFRLGIFNGIMDVFILAALLSMLPKVRQTITEMLGADSIEEKKLGAVFKDAYTAVGGEKMSKGVGMAMKHRRLLRANRELEGGDKQHGLKGMMHAAFGSEAKGKRWEGIRLAAKKGMTAQTRTMFDREFGMLEGTKLGKMIDENSLQRHVERKQKHDEGFQKRRDVAADRASELPKLGTIVVQQGDTLDMHIDKLAANLRANEGTRQAVAKANGLDKDTKWEDLNDEHFRVAAKEQSDLMMQSDKKYNEEMNKMMMKEIMPSVLASHDFKDANGNSIGADISGAGSDLVEAAMKGDKSTISSMLTGMGHNNHVKEITDQIIGRVKDAQTGKGSLMFAGLLDGITDKELKKEMAEALDSGDINAVDALTDGFTGKRHTDWANQRKNIERYMNSSANIKNLAERISIAVDLGKLEVQMAEWAEKMGLNSRDPRDAQKIRDIRDAFRDGVKGIDLEKIKKDGEKAGKTPLQIKKEQDAASKKGWEAFEKKLGALGLDAEDLARRNTGEKFREKYESIDAYHTGKEFIKHIQYVQNKEMTTEGTTALMHDEGFLRAHESGDYREFFKDMLDVIKNGGAGADRYSKELRDVLKKTGSRDVKGLEALARSMSGLVGNAKGNIYGKGWEAGSNAIALGVQMAFNDVAKTALDARMQLMDQRQLQLQQDIDRTQTSLNGSIEAMRAMGGDVAAALEGLKVEWHALDGKKMKEHTAQVQQALQKAMSKASGDDKKKISEMMAQMTQLHQLVIKDNDAQYDSDKGKAIQQLLNNMHLYQRMIIEGAQGKK
jgi:hypothetical protein